jgi:heavy metal translocating P-type ATPase
MLLNMSDYFSGLKMTVISGISLLVSLVLLLSGNKLPIDPAWITIVISGYPLLYLAITRLVYKKWISSALLISIAMIASIYIGEIFAAGEVAFIMAIGAILEDLTINRAKKGLENLISLTPTEGRRIKIINGKEIEEIIAYSEIRVKDIIRIFPGEAITVDGVIVDGNTSVDQSIVTGESLPIDKSVGDKVFCGTLNCFGSIDIEATNVGQDSSLQKLINLVKEAENNKAPTQRIVDKWAIWLVPIALLIAISTYFIALFLGVGSINALNRAVTVLIVFCPCALSLATPTSIVAAIGQSTKHGIIIKSGIALENMGHVDTITFDKTGTITHGKLTVDEITSFNDVTIEDILSLTASAESKSEHPIAKAIVEYTRNLKIDILSSIQFVMIPGKGIQAKVNDFDVTCGNEKYLLSLGITLETDVYDHLDKYRSEGKATILVALNSICVGIISLADTTRSNAQDMIRKLNELGTNTILLTGDNAITANHIAQSVGINSVFSDLLPEEKVSKIEILQSKGHIVCMIGDGVNDAPALKMANVGVAMGSMGSDIAIEAADIALMNDDLSNIPYLKRLSKATINTIKFNITMSMIINVIAVGMSVLGLLNPIAGALVHNAGSVLIVLNAALLYDRKFK